MVAAIVAIVFSSACTILHWSNQPELRPGKPRNTKLAASSSLFVTPKPEPLADFDLSDQPEKYRPFRDGPSHVTMGIRKLNWNDWIQLDADYIRYYDLKASELGKDLPTHVQYVNNTVTRDAYLELLEELVAYLTNRYPMIFQLRDNTLENTVIGETFNYPACNPTEALTTAALLV